MGKALPPRTRLVRLAEGTAYLTDPTEVGTSAATGSTQNLLYGTADVKVYPINEYQLSLLGQNRGWAGLCFTLAGVAFGFGMNLWVSIDLATGVPKETLIKWETIRWACLGASGLLTVAGLVFLALGYGVIRKLRKRTTFG
jgi:hypothetical protein